MYEHQLRVLLPSSLLISALLMPLCAQTQEGIGVNRPSNDAVSVPAATDPGTLRLDYAGIDLHIHEIYLSGGVWQDFDLTDATGARFADSDTPIADMVDTIQNVTRVFSVTFDAHLHQFSLSNGAWHDTDLTALTGAPPDSGVAISAVLDTIQNIVRVHYVGSDDHLHETYLSNGVWRDYDLTAKTGGPSVTATTPIANVVDTIANTVRVDYVGGDSHVHEFYIDGGSWHDADLTQATGAPAVLSLTGIADMVDTLENVLRVHYVGGDSHVHELFIAGGAWHDFDLTAVTGAPQTGLFTFVANVIDTSENVLRVDYAAGGGSDVHEFYISGGAWHDFNLTSAAQAQPAAQVTPIANISDTIQGVTRVHYLGNSAHLHEIYISGGAWHDVDLTAETGGPPVTPLTPIANVLDLLH